MSWSTSGVGKAGKLAETIKDTFARVGGASSGSAEEAAKNQLGEVAETLCKSLPPDKVVKFQAGGSAYNNGDGTASSQHVTFELSTLGSFIE